MSDINSEILEILNMIYDDKNYGGALVRLRLLTAYDKKFKKIIIAMIHGCEDKLLYTENGFI
jgi:hypothetical protein